MPSVGSSSTSSRGRVTSARAMASCCCWPPERKPARRPSSGTSRGNRSSASSTAAGDERRRRLLHHVEVLRAPSAAGSRPGPGARRRGRPGPARRASARVMSRPSKRDPPRRRSAARPSPRSAAWSCRRRCGPSRRPGRRRAPPGTRRTAPGCARRTTSRSATSKHVSSHLHRVAAVAGAAQVDLLHDGVVPDLGHAALAQQPALVQHGHAGGEAAHEVHVVLDDDHRAGGGDAAGAARRCGCARPGSCRPPARRAAAGGAPARAACRSPATAAGRGESPPAQRSARSSQADLLQRLGHAGWLRPLPPAQQRAERRPEAGGQVDVVDDGQLVEDRRRLERAADAEPHDLVLAPADQLPAVEA